MNDFYSPMIPRFRRSRSIPGADPSENAIRARKAWRQLVRGCARGVPIGPGEAHYVLNPLPPIFVDGIQMPLNSLWDPKGMLPALLVQSDALWNFVTGGKRHLLFDLERSDGAALGFELSSGPEDATSLLLPLLFQTLIDATAEVLGVREIVLDGLINRFVRVAEQFENGAERQPAAIGDRIIVQPKW